LHENVFHVFLTLSVVAAAAVEAVKVAEVEALRRLLIAAEVLLVMEAGASAADDVPVATLTSAAATVPAVPLALTAAAPVSQSRLI
jgi:hypothetical protein